MCEGTLASFKSSSITNFETENIPLLADALSHFNADINDSLRLEVEGQNTRLLHAAECGVTGIESCKDPQPLASPPKGRYHGLPILTRSSRL